MGESLTTRSACILLRLGIAGCLAAAAITLGADVSEYPSLNRAGIRTLAQGFLAAGGPPIVWILGSTGALLLVGSIGCAVAGRPAPPG